MILPASSTATPGTAPGNTGLAYTYNPFTQVTVGPQDFTFTVVAGMFVSLIGTLCFVGYSMMGLYLGNGLIMLPYNLVYAWWKRPTPMTNQDFKAYQITLNFKLKAILKDAEELKREKVDMKIEAKGFFARLWGGSGHNSKVSKFVAQFTAMEKEMQVYMLQKNIQDFNPIFPFVQLILGILAALLTILTFFNL